MGYELDAFVAKLSTLRAWQREIPSLRVCTLPFELGLIPGTTIAELGADTRACGDRLAKKGTILFVSASGFGDQSGESALLWIEGAAAIAADLGTALRILGAVAAPGEDELDTLGLGRNTSRWIEIAAGRDDPTPSSAELLLEQLPRTPVGGPPACLGPRAMLFTQLRQAGPLPANAVEVLLPLLDDEDARGDAVELLSRMGPLAAPAVDRLIEVMMRDEHYYIRLYAQQALIGMGAVPAAQAALARGNATSRMVRSVAQVVAKAREMVFDLNEALETPPDDPPPPPSLQQACSEFCHELFFLGRDGSVVTEDDLARAIDKLAYLRQLAAVTEGTFSYADDMLDFGRIIFGHNAGLTPD